jgi:Na+/melibiose symporter-like transporter
VPYALTYISVFITWELFGVSLAPGVNFAYYLVVYCVMQAVTTCYSVPYASLTMELSEDNKERGAVH